MNIASLTNAAYFKKIVFGILALLAVLLMALHIRGCSGDRLLRKSVYQIGRTATLQVELFGRERNVVAFTNDLMASIAAENKLQFQWIETNPTHLVDGLENGTYDFILTSIRPTLLNEDHYVLSELLFDMGPVLIVRQDSQFTSLKDIESKPIGVPYGFPYNFNALRTPGINIYHMSFIYYNNMNRALDDLTNDTIDGVIMPAIQAYAITQGLYAGKLKVVTPPLTDEGLRIASLKSSSLEEVINLINESINHMLQNGTYIQLIEKWNLVNAQSQYWHQPET